MHENKDTSKRHFLQMLVDGFAVAIFKLLH